MILKNLLPANEVNAVFLGRGEDLESALKQHFSGKKAVRMIQTHSDHMAFLDKGEVDDAEIVYLDDLDAVFTDDSDLVLVVRVADCYPILLYHPRGIVGVVHAGRKGTEKNILRKALEELIKRDKWLATGWQIWLGPKICEKCYQINKETDEHYDLKARNTEQLLASLSEADNYALDCGFCTAHQNDWFYSYRKEGEGVGMNYGLITLSK